jgi:hypothetical protein
MLLPPVNVDRKHYLATDNFGQDLTQKRLHRWFLDEDFQMCGSHPRSGQNPTDATGGFCR